MYRDPRLRGLSDDHHQALVLAVTLKRAAKSGDGQMLENARKELVERFPIEIEPHFVVEEQTLLQALRGRGEQEDALIERTEVDHAYLRDGLERAKNGETTHLGVYGDRLSDHVRFEEKELFEHCQNILPDDILDEVWQRRPKPPKN